PLRRGNSAEFTRLARQPRRPATTSGEGRRGTVPLGSADDTPRVDPVSHQGHRKRTDGLEDQVSSFLVVSRPASPWRLSSHLGLRPIASRRRKMVPRLGPSRRQTRNLAARGFRTLARRTDAAGQEKRVGLFAFRSPQISSPNAPSVHHDGHPFVSGSRNRAPAGGKTLRSL